MVYNWRKLDLYVRNSPNPITTIDKVLQIEWNKDVYDSNYGCSPGGQNGISLELQSLTA